MRENLSKFLPVLKQHEGGYSDHPSDPGGCTNMGITIGTYRRHLNPTGSCADLKELSWVQAKTIYSETYWKKVEGDELPHGVDVSVFDMGVNAGPKRAIMLLQRTVGVAEDGIIGPVTWAAVLGADRNRIIEGYHDTRLDYYKSLSTWPAFGKGWSNRTRETKEFALTLPTEGVVPPLPEGPRRYGIGAVIRCTVSTKYNKSEPSARICQSLLYGLGYDVGLIDQEIGPRTDAAIRSFQKNNDLTINGICGSATWPKLEGSKARRES